MRRAALLVLAGFLLCSVASGYYHFIHFPSRTGPFVAIPEKYDLKALRNNTVYYFISNQGPSRIAPGDSLAGWISQIRLAASVWNGVSSSELRVGFGGLSAAETQQSAPGIDVTFDDDMPPGLAALGGVASVGSPVAPADGPAFVPITRGIVRIRGDLRESLSYGERAYMTVVHELGHALGLQHTHTSGVMSTEVTRATSRSKPLSDDDVAAISVLYPTSGFLSRTGAISGRVSADGTGVNLASVVAISANGPAISALTNPDGTYTIQGIPPGSYYLYVHPLPPALSAETWPGNVKPPQDPDGVPIPANGAFDTQFYPGVRDPVSARSLSVAEGETLSGMDFAVRRRAAPALSSITTYGYYGSVAVRPAPVAGTVRASTLVATGTGLVPAPNVLAPDLNVRVLADSGANIPASSVKYYTSGYIRFDVYPGFGWAPGPRHLVFSTRDDIYVLPAGLILVANQGPSIAAVTPASDDKGTRLAIVSGSNFEAATRILFDGVPAAVVDRSEGSITVIPPPAPGGHQAHVVALNDDGQSSLFAQPAGGQTYTYDPADTPMISLSPQSLAAGSEGMVEIIGSNTSFAQGQTVLGFGSSDVTVRRLWVVGPNRLLANVSVRGAAPAGLSDVTAVTGLDLAVIPKGLQVAPPPSTPGMMIVPPVTNAVNGNPGVWPGGIGVLNVSNLKGGLGTFSLTVGDQRATLLTAADGQITFQVPSSLAAGPAVVRLSSMTGETIPPVVMQVDPPPPPILAAYSNPGVLADAANPVRPGSIVGLLLGSLPDSVLAIDPAAIKVVVGAVEHRAFSIGPHPGGVLIQFNLSPNVPPGNQVPAMVILNGFTSQPYFLPVK